MYKQIQCAKSQQKQFQTIKFPVEASFQIILDGTVYVHGA